MKIGLSVDEHIKLSDDLRNFRHAITCDILNKYRKQSPQVKALWKLLQCVQSAQCIMDDAFCKEYPQKEYHAPNKPWVHSPYFWERTK